MDVLPAKSDSPAPLEMFAPSSHMVLSREAGSMTTSAQTLAEVQAAAVMTRARPIMRLKHTTRFGFGKNSVGIWQHAGSEAAMGPRGRVLARVEMLECP